MFTFHLNFRFNEKLLYVKRNVIMDGEHSVWSSKLFSHYLLAPVNPRIGKGFLALSQAHIIEKGLQRFVHFCFLVDVFHYSSAVFKGY